MKISCAKIEIIITNISSILKEILSGCFIHHQWWNVHHNPTYILCEWNFFHRMKRPSVRDVSSETMNSCSWLSICSPALSIILRSSKKWDYVCKILLKVACPQQTKLWPNFTTKRFAFLCSIVLESLWALKCPLGSTGLIWVIDIFASSFAVISKCNFIPHSFLIFWVDVIKKLHQTSQKNRQT